MKILFIENRYRTRFWEQIAEELQKEGNEVLFLVQNHRFKPRYGRVTILPYPGRINVNRILNADNELIKSDRNINYFHHRGTEHYAYYRQMIREYLNRERPDVVFGESTAFHELLTIDLCKELSIPYLQPSTCRFPTGRFSFYRYDTLEPFSGSGEVLPDTEAIALVDRIVHRNIKPDYMLKNRVTLLTKMKRWRDLIHLSMGYMAGEHYNTPAPWIKSRIERKRGKLIRHWDELAAYRSIPQDKAHFSLLYPMQMQPEANLDVWGRTYRNQLNTIQQLIANTPEDVIVLVKPNPKSKYELTESLLAYFASEKRVVPIAHSVQMGEVLPQTDMVLTVTGTIAIECILANTPIVTMIKTLNNRSANCLWAESFDQINSFVELVRNGQFPRIDDRAKIDFINLLNQTSFKGIPYETVMTSKNINACLAAFNKILSQIATSGFSDMPVTGNE